MINYNCCMIIMSIYKCTGWEREGGRSRELLELDSGPGEITEEDTDGNCCRVSVIRNVPSDDLVRRGGCQEFPQELVVHRTGPYSKGALGDISECWELLYDPIPELVIPQGRRGLKFFDGTR